MSKKFKGKSDLKFFSKIIFAEPTLVIQFTLTLTCKYIVLHTHTMWIKGIKFLIRQVLFIAKYRNIN